MPVKNVCNLNHYYIVSSVNFEKKKKKNEPPVEPLAGPVAR